ncbi:Protein Spindly-like [Oopsacas minuta]|uniref:Protein Spindly-like n=1 Tax=Oopsacas minuta TaxID=111878 RepID=A0AAV7JVT4_9METZ|nr:Protein Spindly-like [Oopsacas minuta]
MNLEQKQIEHLEQHCRTLQEEHEGEQKVWEMREQQLISEREMFEQEKHILQTTVNEQAVMKRSLEDELSRSKSLADREHNAYVRRTESEYEKRIEGLRYSENELREENRYVNLELTQTREKLALQLRQIEDLQQENRELSEGERWSGGELRQALEELSKVRDKCMQLEGSNHEQSSRLEQAFLEREILEEKLQLLESEQSQLIDSKEVVQQMLIQAQASKDGMYAELTGVKMELQMMNFKKKGNSLFAEVDDHRKKVELELLALRGSYKSLEGLYKNSQVIARRLKSEYTLLLCQRNSLKADGAYITRLKHDLDRTSNDLSLSRMNCATLERQLSNTHNLAKEFRQYQQSYDNKNPQDREYIRFFNRQISYWESHSKDLLYKLDESRKLECALRQDNADQRTGLHQAEKRAEVCERECTVLKLKLEELSSEAKHYRPVKETPVRLPTPTVKHYTAIPPPSFPSHQDESRMEETVCVIPEDASPVIPVLQPIKTNIQALARERK